ncbi:MAG: transcription elongation factor GreA [Pseudomonadota bacterium]|jgi:transcription elongation factor GreA
MKRPMTPRGYAALRAELMKLKSMRPELARAIEVARGHGDLSENGDYDAAKEKSGMVEAKIRDIETRLAMAEVIDPRKLTISDRVVFGATVTIEDVDSGERRVISIYGAEESDIDKGWISFEAPLGKGLIGKEVGDVVKVALPGGAREYEIVELAITYEETEEIIIS